MTLTAKQIEQAKPKERIYKLADIAGLYLAVLPSGTKSWRKNYTRNGKQATKTFGKFPDMSLAEARKANALFVDEATNAKPPTFADLSKQWLKIKIPTLSNPKHQQQVSNTLENYVLPAIGHKPIDSIKRVELVALLRAIADADKVETAHRVAGRIGMVFGFAQDAGLIDVHPAGGLVRALPPRKTKKPMACVPLAECPQLLSDIAQYPDILTRLGLQMLAHTFVRVGELRLMRWSEVIRKDKVWVVPEERMKLRIPHVVPLSSQVLGLLDELEAINGDCELVFDSLSKRGYPISENTLLFALYRMGYKGKMTAHGFRSLASTALNEQSDFAADVIERQLGHKEKDDVRASYNRAEYLRQRRVLMQWWSDWLDSQLETLNPPSANG